MTARSSETAAETEAAAEEVLPPLADTSSFRPRPQTARGARTRAALVAAARTIFERDGYLGTRLADIPAEAGVATGTFYTYFTSKDEIFRAVIDAAKDDLLYPEMPRREDSPVEQIRAANLAYFQAYERNARLMMILEQVAAADPRFREIRRQRSAAFAERNARAIERLQRAGHADPALDPVLAAQALSGMVGRMAYRVFGLGESAPMDELVETCTRLWANALRLKNDAPSSPRKDPA